MVVLYSNHPVVANPFGLTEPLSVAVVAVTGVAARVLTAGAAVVAKVSTEPNDRPSGFWAIAQK